MNPGSRPVGIQPPDVPDESVIKSWLESLANGSCDAEAFLRAMQNRFAADPDGTWEVLSQLDQYYRRGRIETETFKKIKTLLAESVIGLGFGSPATDTPAMRAAPPPRDTLVAREVAMARDTPVAREVPVPREVPVARDIVAPARAEDTDAHPRREETQSSDSVGELKAGGVLRRRYRIEAIVGQSGMGTVFQVLDEFRLEAPGSQRLAVKVLHPAVAKRADLLADLRREFQSLQLLSHPNIIRVFDFDRDGPLVFFTMELLTGAPLSRILQARRLIPLERPQALGVLRDIGTAVSYAHRRGAVHGDLNLQNVFVTGSGEVRVMGFGASYKTRQISQTPDLEMTQPFSKSTFASCQVLEGERAEARDDMFSLGCLAYLLLSGAQPFPKRTAVEAREAKLRLRRPASVSRRQWQALRSALRWERDDRPADVLQWLSDLELGAARKLPPFNDLLEPPTAKESKSGLAFGIAAGVAALLFAVYWLVSHRNMLPSIDSTASIRAPANPEPHSADNSGPPVSSTPTTTSPPSANTSPFNQAKAPPAAALRPSAPIATPPSRAAPVVVPPSAAAASYVAAAPPVSAPSPVSAAPLVSAPSSASAASPAAASTIAASRVAVPPAKAAAGASKVELAADTVDVPAGQASAQITVHRKGNLRGETNFTWWTESGTAKPGADFSAVVPQLAYVGDGKSNVSLSIPLSIAPHAQAKSFYVVIDQTEGGAKLGARTLTMVTLQPSD
jgi:serine/threonine protein kinase